MFDKHLQTLLHTQQRQRARMIERLKSQGISDSRVLEAMNKVPRHIFVQEAFASRAYEDTALPLGMRQTISQPSSRASISRSSIFIRLSSSSRTELHFSMV